MTPDVQPQSIGTDPAQTFAFLLKAYESSSEQEERAVDIWEIGSSLGLDANEAESIASDLEEMNLVYFASLAGDIALTSFGVSEVVLAQSQPEKATVHFPPLASFSEQLLLPFSTPIGSEVQRLVDQLESCNQALHSSEHQVSELIDRIDALDVSVQRSITGPGAIQHEMINALTEIQLELII